MNTVSPGMIDTDMVSSDTMKKTAENIPMRESENLWRLPKQLRGFSPMRRVTAMVAISAWEAAARWEACSNMEEHQHMHAL